LEIPFQELHLLEKGRPDYGWGVFELLYGFGVIIDLHRERLLLLSAALFFSSAFM
jgi:hypothetical protein